MAHYLGIDIGTSTIKVAILQSQIEVLAHESAAYRLLKPQPGHMEIDEQDLWSALTQCMQRLSAHPAVDLSQVAGIGLACLCPGLTAFDAQGQVLTHPILYSDQRSLEEAQFIREVIDADTVFQTTANVVMAGAMSVTSMLWLKRNRPDLYENTYRFGHVNTMVAHWLTGEFAIDPSNASYTGLFDTAHTRQWSPEFCQRLGIDPEKLPTVRQSHEVVGGLTCPEWVALGLSAGTPVVIGGADTACASLAAGVWHHNEVCESVGTTNVLTVCVDQPVFDRRFLNRCHVLEDRWLYHGAISHAGSSLSWFLEQFCPDLKGKAADEKTSPFALMDREAALSRPGAQGLVFLPYMQGERSPVWDARARGIFFGLSLESNRGDMIRSILEGCGYALHQLIGIAESVTGKKIERLASMGGGAKSRLWAQIKADITGVDFEIMNLNHAAAIGAAMLAMMGTGSTLDLDEYRRKVANYRVCDMTPNPANQATYEARYQVYEELYPRLKDLFV